MLEQLFLDLAGILNSSSKSNLFIECILWATGLAIAGLVFRFDLTKPNVKPKKIKWKRKIAIIILAVFLILILNIITVCLQQYFMQSVSIPGNQKELIKSQKQLPITISLLAIFIGPIFEETIFRKELISFKNKSWLIITYLISSSLFACSHLVGYNSNLFEFIKYLIPGLSLGGVYLITRDIRCSILTHMLYNGIAFISIFI